MGTTCGFVFFVFFVVHRFVAYIHGAARFQRPAAGSLSGVGARRTIALPRPEAHRGRARHDRGPRLQAEPCDARWGARHRRYSGCCAVAGVRRGAATRNPLPGCRPGRAQQAGRPGRAPRRGPPVRDARQRAASSHHGSQRHRRRVSPGHRPSPRPWHVGRHGDCQERRSSPGAVTPVPGPRGREGVHRARVGCRPGGPPHRCRDRPRSGQPAEDVRPRQARARAR